MPKASRWWGCEMTEQQIDEVMGLVEILKNEWAEYLSVEDDEVIAQGLKVDSVEEAIRAKLREILQVGNRVDTLLRLMSLLRRNLLVA